MNNRQRIFTLIAASFLLPAPGLCQTQDEPTKPSGTLLLPLTPKIEPAEEDRGNNTVLLPLTPKIDEHIVTTSPPKTKIKAEPPARVASLSPRPQAEQAPSTPSVPVVTSGQANICAENGDEDAAQPVTDETLLKGTVQITADDTEYDQDKNTFLGTGNAVAIIGGQDSRLEADSILYDENKNIIDARGNVKILRGGQLTTGSAVRFKADSDEYLLTDANTELRGTTVISRRAQGTKAGVMFRDGNFTLDKPFHLMNNAAYGPMSQAERVGDESTHPDAYVTQHPSFKVTGRKMVLERYKEDQNLTVYGGKLVFGKFNVPLGTFVANVGTGNSRVIFPVTPMLGNNMMVGGTNVGPQFNYAVGKTGAFSWAPLLQFGGASGANAGALVQGGKLGAGFKAGLTTDVFAAHLAYGSNSNILVGDLKYRINKKTYFQSGINRFLNNGMFGMQRARLLAEVVNTQVITTIPYISSLSFRSSAGWAQDDPALLALSGANYAKLFNQTHTGKVGAYRLQEQISAASHPIFAIGDQKYGAELQLAGGIAARAYSTGDRQLITQGGPMFTARFNRARIRIGYNQAAVRGQSPFVFDQFIQGTQSTYMQGDVKLTKWLTVGGALGYNLTNKLLYQKGLTAALGPEDFKVIFTHDFITGYQRFGFDVLYGQPVNFGKLLIKNAPDAGTLGRAGGIF